MHLKLLLTAALAVLPTLAQADEPAVEALARVGRWEMNYDADSCHLIAAFGEGDSQVSANITRFEPGDVFELRLYGQRFGRRGVVTTDVSTDFSSDSTVLSTPALRGMAGEVPMLVLHRRALVDSDAEAPPPISAEQEQTVENVTVQVGRNPRFKMLLGPMGAPMRAMRACTTNLVRSWGFDPDEQASLSRRATLLNNEERMWRDVLRDLFVGSAEDEGAHTIIRYRVTVESDGSVGGCTIQDSSRGPAFGVASCRGIARYARFTPALSAAGVPIRSYFTGSMHWVVMTS